MKRRREKRETSVKTALMIFLFITLTGCASYNSYSVYSTNDVPLESRKPPSMYRTIIISMNGPQLDPEYYETMGIVRSNVDNLTVFENRIRGAMEKVRNEARSIGADALINVSCGKSGFGSACHGYAISFKDREECLRRLKEIGAVILD